MRVYCDSSVLVALYVPEVHSDPVRAFLKRQQPVVFINLLQESEFKNTLRQKVFRKEITEAVLAQCLRVFHDDCILGKIQQKTIPWTAAFTEAEKLSRRVAARQACRFFDLLHVAIAVISDADFFATLDEDQAALAESAGLKAVDLS